MTSDPSLAKSTLFWTIVGAVAAVLALLLLDPVRAFLRLVGHGVAVGAAGGWSWLGTSHGVPGWLLVGLILAAACGGWVLVLALLAQRPARGAKNFTLILNGVQWRGQIAQAGTVVGVPAPHCPHCQCQIRPAQGWNYRGGGYFTQLHCEDCGRTNQTEAGTAKDAYNRAARRVEAKWLRGELGMEVGQ